MKIIDGKAVSNTIKDELKLLVDKNTLNPGLGIILVGNRPDSKIYVKMKIKACEKIGIKNYDVYLNENITEKEIIEEVIKMNNNDSIHGILIQLPLPKHINEQNVLSKVLLEKDVDGFHVQNVGNLALKRMNNCYAPCTPTGCIELLKRYNVEISGKHVVILGRSNIVGMPLSLLFLHNDATVTICHSKTNNLKEITNNADILVAACGKPNFINKEYIKNDVVILDIGINKIPFNNEKGYKIVGDVDFDDVFDKVKLITPVPGGIGPMTICMLLKHTIDSCLNYKLNSLLTSE
jgi:5,10-methylene-tetrahydrofolate dehydrogenase/methenyl tetrahydrofolate cyclohydrolase